MYFCPAPLSPVSYHDNDDNVNDDCTLGTIDNPNNARKTSHFVIVIVIVVIII